MLSWTCLALTAFSLWLGTSYAGSTHEEDERTIRSMVDQAVARLNKGDVTAFDDFGTNTLITLVLTERIPKGGPRFRHYSVR